MLLETRSVMQLLCQGILLSLFKGKNFKDNTQKFSCLQIQIVEVGLLILNLFQLFVQIFFNDHYFYKEATLQTLELNIF